MVGKNWVVLGILSPMWTKYIEEGEWGRMRSERVGQIMQGLVSKN